MDTILDEYSIEGRNLLDIDITKGKEIGYQFIFNTKTNCLLKEYKCNGINCNVELVEMLK